MEKLVRHLSKDDQQNQKRPLGFLRQLLERTKSIEGNRKEGLSIDRRNCQTVYISHSNADDPVVKTLRQLLEDRGYLVKEDATAFDFNSPFPPQIRSFIDKAKATIVVVSQDSAESPWVKAEIDYASRQEGHTVVPLLLLEKGSPNHIRDVFQLEKLHPGMKLEDFPPTKIAVRVPGDPPRLSEAVGELVARIEGQSYDPGDAPEAREVSDLADLVLELSAPEMKLVKSKEGAEVLRPVATAQLVYHPPRSASRSVDTPVHDGDSREAGGQECPPSLKSPEFQFVAPLGKVEASDLRFYLERYLITPFGEFTKRKERIEAQFPEWGGDLYDALLPDEPKHAAVIEKWQEHIADQRRFTIQAPKAPRRVAEKETDPQNSEATAEILALPWELIHDGQTFLFLDGKGVRVRRALPGARKPPKPKPEHLKPPLRVLIVCSRPEDDSAGYIDHRVSVRPLIEALNSLGELATYHVLAPATFKNLQTTLQNALNDDKPYHIVHFDGHGVFRKSQKSGAGGLGMLVFEAEDESSHCRSSELVGADRFAAELANQGIQLFFLEACESAEGDRKTMVSAAAGFLRAGVQSVAAMSNTVLVETARQFTSVFYTELVEGHRVGAAMLEGQRALAREKQRGFAWEPGENPGDPVKRTPLLLDDWFVPVLFQHLADPPLLTEPAPSDRVRAELERGRELALGAVPKPPPHAFVGRSRELLAAERLLIERDLPWVLFRGKGGEGKTTIAAELARWLVETRRIPRAAFASVEHIAGPRAVLWEWGNQLVPRFGAQAGDSEESALELIVKTLRDRPAVLILDNVESILPAPRSERGTDILSVSQPPANGQDVRSTPPTASLGYEPTLQQEIFALCRRLLAEAPGTKLILTSREVPPEDSGFSNNEQTTKHNEQILEIGRLAKPEGVELVARVLAERQQGGESVDPKALEAEKEAEIEKLVDLVRGHARSLVLLTPELAERGLTATTEELAEILEEMNQREGAGRETSLVASMELSLRRLPEGVREKLQPLGAVEGGGCLWALEELVEFSVEEFLAVMAETDKIGLGDFQVLFHPPSKPEHFYLAFDPALAPALLTELRCDANPAAESEARRRHAEAYRQFTRFLCQQETKEAQLVSRLTQLELPNLLAALRWFAADTLPPESEAPELKTENLKLETLIAFAAALEQLLANLNRPTALREASALRARAAELLGDTRSHSTYLAMRKQFDRLLESGQIPQALQLAQSVVQRAEAAGPEAYDGAAYDLATAHFTFGRALRVAGAPREALPEIETARQGFEALAAGGNANAAKMASACLTEAADCHTALGQLEEAARNYEEAIERCRKRDDLRDVAVNTSQLATVRLQQQAYAEALRLYHEAREVKETLGESTAVEWHQIGRVHEETGNLEAAEEAYLKALALGIQFGSTKDESLARGQLGNLYNRMPGRLEEAVVFHRQAAEIFAELGQAMQEGMARNNLADTLIQLCRYDEARAELTRALEITAQFGHNAEPWKTRAILEKLETAAGNPAAAAKARAKAMAAYEAARRDGWQILEGTQRLVVMAGQALKSGNADAIEALQTQLLPQLAQSDYPENVALGEVLAQLLAGSHDPALAEHPGLHNRDAVEVKLLLETLSAEA